MKALIISFLTFFAVFIFPTVAFADAPHIISISPDSGPAGQEVTIVGDNFNPNGVLNFANFNSTRVAGIRGGGNFFVVAVPSLSPSTVSLTAQSIDPSGSGNLLTSDNSMSFQITGASNQAPGQTPGTPNKPSNPRTPNIQSGNGITIENPLNYDTVEDLLNAVIDFIFWVGITVAPIMLIIAGFMYVTSGGTGKLETAKNLMKYTFIGLAVLLLARGLVAVLQSIIGVK